MGFYDKLNNKGQALVEFVLVLPLLIMLLFVIIDFGIIFSTKNSLENDSTSIVSLFNSSMPEATIKQTYPDIDMEIIKDNAYTKIVMVKKIDLITPGLNLILDNPYEVRVERIIPYD